MWFEMLQAQLEGKLTRAEENMEDLLTSNVFGSIKYVAPEEGLGPILASSVDINGEKPFRMSQIMPEPQYKFWPTLREQGCNECEPDVLIAMELSTGQKIVLLVEAKYLSGKSSQTDNKMAPMDQLAREYDNLRKIAAQMEASPVLLYVTADIGFPTYDIEESKKEFREKTSSEMNVFWISWRKLPELFASAKKDSILNDLVRVLRRQLLTFYEGIAPLEPVVIPWSFEATINWNWFSYEECNITWKYGINKDFNWKNRVVPVQWRFGK